MSLGYSTDGPEFTEELRKKNTWCGIRIKKNFGFDQWLVIPIIQITTCTIGVYMNTCLTFMLPVKTMYNIPKEKMGTVTSNIVVYSQPFVILALSFVSYAFELFGRKITLFCSYFVTGILFFILPHTSPSYGWLLVVRIGFGIFMAAPMAHPLVADYVHRDSRGKAVVLAGIGIVIGEIFSISLFKITVRMGLNFFQQFYLMGCIVIAMSIYVYKNLKDPDLAKLQSSLSSPTSSVDIDRSTEYRETEDTENNKIIPNFMQFSLLKKV